MRWMVAVLVSSENLALSEWGSGIVIITVRQLMTCGQKEPPQMSQIPQITEKKNILGIPTGVSLALCHLRNQRNLWMIPC